MYYNSVEPDMAQYEKKPMYAIQSKNKMIAFYVLLALCLTILLINLLFLLYAVSIIVISRPEHVDLI